MARLAMRSKAALIAGGMLVAGLAAPASAQDPGDHTTCVSDPSGDTRDQADDTLSADPRADITKYCVTSGPTSSFYVSVDQPTDPSTDPGWQGATFIGWFVDTDGDGGGDFFMDYSLDSTGSDHSARTARIKRGSDHLVTCTVTADVTEAGYAFSGIDQNCFDGTSVVEAEVAMFYDTGVDVIYDSADGVPATDIESTRTTRRLDGADRTETSVRISQEQFSPGEATTVYLARSDVFADAAVGGILTNGPILVVPSCGDVPAVVRNEIVRLRVGSVTALGGTDAICQQMLDSASDGTGQDRIGGADRFETSTLIAKAQFPTADRVYLARADEFIDAVAGGTLTDGPILLVPQCPPIPTVILDTIEQYDPDEVVALGGPKAICDPILQEAANGRPSSRIAGPDRYATAMAIAQHVFPEPGSAPSVYLARADLVIDALAGGILTDGPLLVVDSCGDFDVNPLLAVGDEISRIAPDEVVALGGTEAICDTTLEQAGEF